MTGITGGPESFQYRDGDYLNEELSIRLSRIKIDIPVSSGDLLPGTVVSVDAAGSYLPFTGAETNLAVIYRGVPDSTIAQKAIVTYRLSGITEDHLIVPTLTPAQRDAMIADFEQRMVIVAPPSGLLVQ